MTNTVNHNKPFLSTAQLKSTIPAAFSNTPHSKTGEKYMMVHTSDMVKAMAKEGWLPTYAHQSHGRTIERNLSNRHVVRFRHVESPLILNDSHVEVVLMNSHNHATCFQLHAGLFRLVCLNGLVLSDSLLSVKKYRHQVSSADDIIEGTYEVINESPLIEDKVRKYRGLFLSQTQQLELANRALPLLTTINKPTEQQLITRKRVDDRANNLWTTFNVMQENIITGGLQIEAKNKRLVKTRGIANVKQNVQLNKNLWEITDNYYHEVKAA